MEDTQRVCGRETVGDLNAGGEESCRLAGPSEMILSSGLPGMYCMTM